MFTLEVKNKTGQSVGTVTIEKKLLGEKVRPELLQEACVMYEANRRSGTHSTKGRSEVAGSHKKMYAQKHTGRARAGTRRAPNRVGGGIAHGPKPRDYSYDIGKNARRQALKSALLSKFMDNEVVVLDELVIEKPRTKDVAGAMEALGLNKSVILTLKHYNTADSSQQDFCKTHNKNVTISARNIPGITVMKVPELNAYEVLRTNRLLFTREAFENLKEMLSCWHPTK
jgi:large subunit ribosomal protein L4